MVYYVYKETLLFKIHRFFFVRKSDIVLYWGKYSDQESCFLSVPPTNRYHSIIRKSREHIDKYFSILMKDCNDAYLVDYLKSLMMNPFSDYFAFVRSIEQHNTRCCKYKIIGGAYLESIYDNSIGKPSDWRLIGYFIFMIMAFIGVINKILLCAFDKKNVKVPDVLYYRKKDQADPMRFKSNMLKKSSDKITSEIFWIKYTTNKSKHEIVSINHFDGALVSSLISVKVLIINIFYDIKYIRRLNLPFRWYYTYIKSVFDASVVVNLNFKVMLGVLDKPIFIMINKLKNKKQNICVMSDGFSYPPALHVDYVYGDFFYAWNEMEANYINKNGGHFARILETGSPKSIMKPTSNGVSEELESMVNKFNKVILVVTTQTYSKDKIFYPFSAVDLNLFVNEINKIAKSHGDILFIIKYKKGEYKIVDKEVRDCSISLDNVFSIYSDIPLELRYNQFQDILEESDLMISICSWSTTIWEALRLKVPVIACNDKLPSSFLKSFNNLEIKYSELESAIDYWLNLSEDDFVDFLQEIDELTNLSIDGSDLMFDHLRQLILNK